LLLCVAAHIRLGILQIFIILSHFSYQIENAFLLSRGWHLILWHRIIGLGCLNIQLFDYDWKRFLDVKSQFLTNDLRSKGTHIQIADFRFFQNFRFKL